MMKLTKTILTGVATLSLGVLLSSDASALSLRVSRTPGTFPSRGDGGEFTLRSETLSNAAYDEATQEPRNGFQSFCLEYFAPIGDERGSYRYAYQISDSAKGPGQGRGGDPISIGTAWLYSQFCAGELDTYDYDPGRGRRRSADRLQDAIWDLEDERDVTDNRFLDLVINEFGNLDNAKLDANGAYGVVALNLFEGRGKDRRQIQDQLYCRPGVPDGGSTAILLSSAFGAMAWFRRRRGC